MQILGGLPGVNFAHASHFERAVAFKALGGFPKTGPSIAFRGTGRKAQSAYKSQVLAACFW